MQVETYEVNEVTTALKVENFDECQAIVQKLALDGQTELFNPEKKEVSPYRKMMASELLVYSNLLPKRTKINQFKESAIPLRVLQVAAHVMETNFCTYLEVWHTPNADFKDPLLVGIKGTEWSGERYILARWGEVLEPFAELVKKAKVVIIANMKAKIADAQHELVAFEKNLDVYVNQALEGQNTKSVYASVSIN